MGKKNAQKVGAWAFTSTPWSQRGNLNKKKKKGAANNVPPANSEKRFISGTLGKEKGREGSGEFRSDSSDLKRGTGSYDIRGSS